MTDNNDGTYSGTYFVPLDGMVTVSVFLTQTGGAYAEYFENFFMDSTPAVTAIEPTINHDWGTGLITPSASDFVSARWYTRVKAPLTEDFFFTIEADDGVRVYFNQILKIDRWDTCWEDQIFMYYLVEGEFYDIKIEYKEEQGSARVKLYWSSLSVPKEIVPSSALYYPRYVGASPYQVTVSTGPSVASKSIASGTGLSSEVAGKLSQFQIISRDFASAPIYNQQDNYAIILMNNDGSGNGDLAITAIYQGAVGIYSASYVPMKTGVFSMPITLLNVSISGSPFTVMIKLIAYQVKMR